MPAYYDAHNHLQDHRLEKWRSSWEEVLHQQGLQRAVVNGTNPDDWKEVSDLAEKHNWIIPNFGVHPWFVKPHMDGKSLERIEIYLDQWNLRNAGIGEIGLDRWVKGYDLASQLKVFRWQWNLAVERNVPVTVHCLRAWGALEEVLRDERPAPRGFLLHSYGGPAEMVKPFAKLGAYFSFSGYFADEKKVKKREAFLEVPLDRLLIETDAPDMLPPKNLRSLRVRLPSSEEINHPANLFKVYEYAAGFFGVKLDEFRQIIERNFIRLFHGR